MPELEKLEQFNRELIQAGNEPAIVSGRGEEVERVLTPEEYPMDSTGPGVKVNRGNASEPSRQEVPSRPASAGSGTDDFLSSLDPGLFGGASGGGDASGPEGVPDSERRGDSGPAPSFDDLFNFDESPSQSSGPENVFDDDILKDLNLPGVTESDETRGPDAEEEPARSESEAPTNFDDLFGDGADPGGGNASATTDAQPENDFNFDNLFDEPSGPTEEPKGGLPGSPDGNSDDSSENDPFADFGSSFSEPGADEPSDTGADSSFDGLFDQGPEADSDGQEAALPDFDVGPSAEDESSSTEDSALDDFLGTLGQEADFNPDIGEELPEEPATARAGEPESSGAEEDFASSFDTDFDLDEPAAGTGGLQEEAAGAPDDDADFGNLFTDEVPQLDDEEDSSVPNLESESEAGDFLTADEDFSSGGDSVGEKELTDLGSADDFDLGDTAADFESQGAKPGETGREKQPPAGDLSEMPDFSSDLDADFGADSFSEEFDMGDFGKAFGVMDEVQDDAWGKENKPADGKDAKPSIVKEAEEEIQKATIQDEAAAFDLSAKDFNYLRESLAAMPLNLKIATEEALGNPDLGFDALKGLISALVRGESPRDIAAIVSRFTGKKIKVPAGYEKKTGLAFEQEQKSFAYQFRENILPIVRTAAMIAIAAGLLFYAGYQFVFRPLYGNSLYDRGIEAIRAQEYAEGNRLFKEAYGIWPDNDRYIQYAHTFREIRQDTYARQKYEELLGMPNPREKPLAKDRLHRAGILDFADFLAYSKREYGTAVNYLYRLVELNKYDHDPVLAQGDIFMEWARYTQPGEEVRIDRGSVSEKHEGPEALYEAARYSYASLISKEGQTDPLLSRMLRYFMRTGKEAEAIKIKNLFLKDPEAKPDPAVIAELAGYLIDSAEENIKAMEEAFQLSVKSLRGEKKDEPGLHYQLARYYRFLRSSQEEGKALSWAQRYFEQRSVLRPLDRFEQSQYIDSLIREGERLYGPLYDNRDFVNAQPYFQKARDLYENSLNSSLLRERSPLLGRVYSRLGDILYYEALDLEGALRQYTLGRQNGYGIPPALGNPALRSGNSSFLPVGDAGIPKLGPRDLLEAGQDVSYKVGYIWYSLSQRLPESSPQKPQFLDRSVREFLQTKGAIPLSNVNLQYALANVQYLRGDYESAIASYRLILERLRDQRQTIPELLINEDVYHRELIEFMIRTNNNLGASLYHLYRQGGPYGPAYLGQAQYYISRATELYENAARDEETAVRSDRISLAYLNLRGMVSPGVEGGVDIYRDLRRDLGQNKFSTQFLTSAQ